MKLKDYLHYYLGHKVPVIVSYTNKTFIGHVAGFDSVNGWQIQTDNIFMPFIWVENAEHIKPFLHDDFNNTIPATPTMFHDKLKNHQDIFGLVKAGLAIDSREYFKGEIIQ